MRVFELMAILAKMPSGVDVEIFACSDLSEDESYPIQDVNGYEPEPDSNEVASVTIIIGGE